MTHKDKQDVIAVCNILADKMSDSGKVAVQQIIDAVKDMVENAPCEDCISRESVRQLICKNNDKYGYSDRFHEFTERCLQLPSVTPSYNSVKSELKPSDDCISRAALLEELGEEPFNWHDSPREFQEVSDYQWFRSLVENAPSVTPKAESEDEE